MSPFRSGFADELEAFVRYRKASGSWNEYATLIGLELLSRLFKNLGLKSFIIEFSTHNKDIPKIISSSLTKGEFMVVSYQMDERGTGDTATFDVTMVVKSKRKDDEVNLVALLNDYEDVVVRRIE